MKFYVLASFIIFILVINHSIRRNNRSLEQKNRIFWDRERRANQTRRKPLDNLDYIRIPLEKLPMELLKEDSKVADCLRIVNDLSLQPVVNLTGYSNTDLKLEYGTANITVLTEYDQNYTLLANTLQQWAERLYQAGEIDAAREILEFAVSTRTDVCGAYDLLSEIYRREGRQDRIAELAKTAESLNSLNRERILRHLKAQDGGSGSDQ
ncbi:MAG: hypothetical protein NC399_06210 [Muribaculum sp.]|nr:hypothetical protein [Muribaculum sp.]